MRIVLDTNTVLSALLWGGKPYQIIALIEHEHIVHCTSPHLIAEFHDVINRSKFGQRLKQVQISAEEATARYIKFSTVVTPPEQIPAVIDRDPDDDLILACAVAASVDYIISGDQDLLELKSYQGIPILSASDFLAVYEAASAHEP